MALEFRGYDDGGNARQQQYRDLNQTISGIGNDLVQAKQLENQRRQQAMEMALKQAQAGREKTVFDQQQQDYQRQHTPQGQDPGWQGTPVPGAGDLSMESSPFGVQPPNTTSANPLSILNGARPTPQEVPQNQESPIVTMHKQMYPHLASNGRGQTINVPGAPQGINDLYNDPNKSPYDIAQATDRYKTGLGYQEAGGKIGLQESESAKNYAEAQKALNEAKGGGAAGDKADQAALKDIQDSYNKDKNVVTAQGSLDKLETARGLLDAGVTNNAIAKQALTTALTFVSTGGQRVNAAEMSAFLGGDTLTNKANQWMQHIEAGTLTPRDAADMRGVISIYENSAKKNLSDRQMSYAKQLGQRTRKDPKAEYKRITGNDYQEPDPSQSQGGSQTQIGRFKVTVH